ncbi:MAG TPA: phasin family protein [Magnetospirillaceae bacterium]|jgi:hypothetical protein
MAPKDTRWIEQLQNAFPPFTWPTGFSPAEAMLGWIDVQQKFFTAATEASRQVWTAARKEVETGNGILRRLATAKSPEEAVAAQRDLAELMSSVYFEQMTSLSEQFNQFVKATSTAPPKPPTNEPAPAKPIQLKPPGKKKRAAE